MLTSDAHFNITLIGGVLVFITMSILVGVFLFNTLHYHSTHHIVDATPWLSILTVPASVTGFVCFMTYKVKHL